ncbi:hypothetical protein FSP39_010103 [Pinctada imbricata]|uniref:C-type lectin domain-containing protein n=1 Tax=Pinctada imbricata TaxID=66713 RepID=A0AA88XVT1_PINIB|nr:hypothetical protein FSP39_010103 [Pinctada imbricata]
MSGHIPHLFPLHVETAENPLCLLLNVEPADGEVGVIRLREFNLRGERSTLGEEKSLLLLKVDDGKVTVVIEGNLKGKLCSLYGGDLAIVESADEQLWIESYLKKTWNKANQTDGIWLGGTDLLIENEWIWAKTGESFEYQRWGPNEPSYHQGNSNVDENCLELLPHKSFMWNDESCEHAKNFLCEAQ